MPIITPKGADASSNQAPQQPSSRDRAIAKLMGSQQAQTAPDAQTAPVRNPSRVAPEEMSVITPPSTEGQADTTETPVAASPEPTEATQAKTEEQPLSQQYAVLARKEKALRAKVQAQDTALKAREAALAEREAATRAKEAEYQSKYINKDSLAQDPWSVLQSLGITYDQVTEQALNQTQQDPATKAALARLEAQIKAQDEVIQNARKAQVDQEANQYKQAVKQIKTEANNLVNSDPSYETIKETGSVDDVVDLIERTFKEDNILLSVEEAAKLVEDHLIEEAVKLSRLKKIQQRLAPKVETPPKPSEPENKQPQQMKTLTNNISSTRQLSSRERAILAFNNAKK